MTLERRKLRRSIPFLEDLDQHLFHDIKRIFVFGRDGDAAFFITKDDHVFAYGKNACGCLGLGFDEPVNEPRPVECLTRRRIVEFSAGRCHVLALSKSGRLFACGSNEHGQLALGNDFKKCNVPKLVDCLHKERIVAVACGAFHSLALTSRGLVLGWGYNFWGQLGLGHNHDQMEPVVIALLRKENIVEISCGQHHNVALSRKGDLYAWGHNAYGQLGIGERVNFKNIPIKVIRANEFTIKHVTCGQNHVLAVSTDGKLLGFGSNYYGQLGTGSRQNEIVPVKIIEDRQIKNVLSSPFSNTSVARTNKRNSLIFGKCGDNWLLSPIDTPEPEIKNHQEAFTRINATTANTTVVKSKPNRWWHLLYFVKNKFF